MSQVAVGATGTLLTELVPLMRRQPGFPEVLQALELGHSATIDGAWGSACALVAATLAQATSTSLLIVLPRLSQVDEFASDLAGFLGETPEILPAWEALPREGQIRDLVFGTRLRLLRDLRAGKCPKVIVTCAPALLQPVPEPEAIAQATRSLKVGDSHPPEDLLRWFIDQGCERVPAIQFPGEVAVHGGILDVFPPDATEPLRFEFFGDEIESIRKFDAESQRKLESLASVDLTLLSPPKVKEGEGAQANVDFGGAHFLDSFPKQAWIALVELPELIDEGKHYLARLDQPRGFFSVPSTLERCTARPTITLAALSAGSYETSCHLKIESIERLSGTGGAEAVKDLASIVGKTERVLLACHNAGEQTRLAEMLEETDLPATGRASLCVGYVAHGFRLVGERLIVLGDHELFRRRDIRQGPKKRAVESRAIDSFLELSEGDLVVHVSHGVARYRGMKLMHKDNQSEEHLVLEFRDSVQMYVPVSLIHLVQKYVGGGKSGTPLSKVGTSGWEKKKQQVSEALADLASDMLRLQAEREIKEGHAFPADTHWMQEFEAAFPYTETDDQARAIIDVKQDMQSSKAMDRLICGDVGYGKTEVAMRSAFKALDAGKQVAVLVPTTVLAEQHYRSFRERMAEYPFNIEVLSRFRSRAEQQEVIKGLQDGSVDLVVGTHRLVSKDVRFRDLGLLVIDEEQRFGVEVKEKLKQLRLEVDVLTLSATPIPRTLHLSLMGIRDISNLTTPPQDRQAIETRICRFDETLIRQAIGRELNRGGQIYFVHNRVYDIEFIAERLQRIVPEARIGIVHGQMPEHELEDAMSSFVRGQLDLLLATTIIESGLDIPRANTIFIHEAENYGLADLHQLRGRVGRYKHRAYCYLLLEEGRSLSDTAAKRLKAIEEFSELGAGFKIAMRDLEIRGAGNILGNEQSGHIASIGYELYCQLLENAVRRLKNEPVRQYRHVAVDLPLSAFFAGSYIPPGRHKIEVYRRLSQTASLEELTQLKEELRDRFGPMPAEAECLFEIRELQLLAWQWQIDKIHLEDKFAVFRYRITRRIRELGFLLGDRLRVVDNRTAVYVLKDPGADSRTILQELKSVLQWPEQPAYIPQLPSA